MADQKKVETGREMLAAYRKKKKSPSKKERGSKTPENVPRTSGDSSHSFDLTTGPSDSETSGTTICLNESSNSSNNEGGDLQRLSTRIKELEEIVAGKDAALAAQREELDMSKEFSVDVSSGMLSFGLESDYKACLEKYQQRLEEFESAVNHRDDLIRQLSEGLRLAKLSHEAKEEQLAQGIELLQRQLHAATQLVQGHSWDTGVNPHDYLLLKNQMLTLEDTVQKNTTVINELNATIRQKDETLQAKAEELSALKSKAAREVQELMREIEDLNQQSQTTINNITLDETVLRAQIEEGFGLQLSQIKVELRNQLALEYSTELNNLKQQLETMTTNCRNAASVEDKLTTELASYEVELTLHKEQTEILKQKLAKLASEMEASELSRQSELMSYKQQVATLNVGLTNATILQAEVNSLTKNLSVLKETHARELEHCRQNHIREVDILNQQNETLEMELDKLQTEEVKCAAELNACKEAFIAQFGVSKLTNETEVTSLRQQVQALTVQLKDAGAVKEKSSTELDSKRDTLERELKVLHEDKVNALNETINQLLTSQESLVKENALYVSQMDTYKDWLQEKSLMEEGHRQDVMKLQKEASSYKEQVENVEEKHSIIISTLTKTHEEQMHQLNAQLQHTSDVSSAEINLLNEQIRNLKNSLDETVVVKDNAIQELELSRGAHKAEVVSYENKMLEINMQLTELTLQHNSTVSSMAAELEAANAALQKKTRLADACQDELRVCKDQLAKLNAKHGAELQDALENYGKDMQAALEKYGKDLLIERDQITDIYNSDLAEIHQQIHNLTKRLSKESRFDQVSTDMDSLSLSPGIKKEISDLQFLIKCREDNFGTIRSQLLETMAMLQSTQALLVGKEELELSLHERELMLNQANESFTAVKESESALERQVQDLEEELDRRSKECASVTEMLQKLSAAEIQGDPLTDRGKHISELEATLRQTNNDFVSVKNTLQETVVKLLTAQTLLDAKEEIESSLQNRVSELMASLQTVSIDSQAMRAESERLTLQVAKAKELLKRLKAERDNLIQLNKEHEEKINVLQKQLSVSDSRVQDLVIKVENLEEQVASKKVEASQVKSNDSEYLTSQIMRLQNKQEDLVTKCDGYEEEVRRLQGQLTISENTVVALKQELSNNKSAHDLAGGPRDVERRESIMASGDQVAITGLSFLGNSFYGENNNSGFFNNMSEYMDVASFKTREGMDLIENYNQLEKGQQDLERTVESLRDKLKEKELNEELCKQEIATSLLRHKDLEARLAVMTNNLEQVEINIAEKIDLENKVTVMEGELKTLQDIQGNLQNELLNKQVAYEEKLHKLIQEQLSESMLIAKSDNIEELIRELGGKAKEVVVLSEKLRAKEQSESALNTRVEMLEECKARYVHQLSMFKEEASNARLELQESWQNQRQVQDELGQARRELALLQLTNQQLENSQARLRDASSGSSFIVAKMAALREILEQQANRQYERPVDESQSNVSCSEAVLDSSVSDLRNKLEGIFKRDTDHVRSPPRPDDQASLAAEVAFYREQHATLAEVLGSAGALQDALQVHKQQERCSVDDLLNAERSKVDQLQLRLKVLEQEATQRDGQCVELERQRSALERELTALEERQKEREEVVGGQQVRSEAELRERDLRIRQWQVQCKAKEVELSYSQALSQLTSPPPTLPLPGTDRLDRLRHDLDEAHEHAVTRLKLHLQEVFALQETETRMDNAQQLADLEQQHVTQLANSRQQIQAKIQELDTFQRLVDHREKHETDLEEIKLKLDESQKEVYSVLRKQFECFAQQQVNAAVEKLQAQHELMLASQTSVHVQELQALKAKLELQKQKEILSIKQELLQRHERDVKDLQKSSETELARIQTTPCSYPSDSKSAIHLLKQLLCNEFSASFRTLSSAEYGNYRKQLSAISLQLETALEQEDSLDLDNIEGLVATQNTLVEQAQALLQTIVLEHSRTLEVLGEHLDVGHTQLLNYLEQTARDVDTAFTVATLRDAVAKLEQQSEQVDKQHKFIVDQLSKDRDEAVAKLDQLKAVVGIECGPCAFLRQELEAKHTQEVEELRQYFEQKCADVEKHYSEEIFSQHSRKLSTSSSSCDNELVSDQLCYGSGDHTRANTHICDPLDPTYKDLDGQCRLDYDKRLVDYRDQLDSVKRDMEDKYRLEIDGLKEDYEAKVEELVRDLTSSHQTDLSNVETKHRKELENVQEKLRSEVESVRDDLEAKHAKQLGDLKITFEKKLAIDMETLTDRMLSDEADHIERVKAELEERHARALVQLEASLAERVEELQYSEKRSQELCEREQAHKLDAVEQLQVLLVERKEGKFGNDYRKQLEELEVKHREEMESQCKVLAEQMEQFTEMVKLGAEQEQDKFMKVQKEIMSGFLLQHKQDVKILTEQFEAQINMAQEEIRKLLTERAEYEELIVQGKRRLHAEVLHDVVATLDEQLQLLLTEGGDTSLCPPELLQLQDKFSARYKVELVALKQELTELRQARQVPLAQDSLVEDSCQATLTDRDQHFSKEKTRQLAKTMKSLVCELTKYVSVCEDELNNTLVDQLLKYEADSCVVEEQEPSLFRDAPDTSASLTNGDIPFLSIMSNLDNSDLGSKSLSNDNTMNKSSVSEIQRDESPVDTSGGKSERKIRRVHFAPNISNIVNMDEEGLMEYMEKNSESATSAIRAELDSCLERLKADAQALMGAASSLPKQVFVNEQQSEVLRQLASEVEAREQLSARLDEFKAYKTECERLAELIEKLGSELCAARMRISELESREDITEGYGEQGHSTLTARIKNLAELKDQARCILNEGIISPPHGHLIEELCREGDRLVEEAKQEKEDLQLQVEAADKQLRATRLFLEEQATEREQERDDFLQEISRLTEQLKVNENLKVDGQQLSKEVETLEVQVKEATSLLKEAEARKEELEAELKAAIDKVWVLRDIISDLESQVEIKSRNGAAMEEQLRDMQTLLDQQTGNNQDLTNQLNSEHSDMVQHIKQLEEQLNLHRQQVEQLQPDSVAIKQLTTTLRDFESTLDKKTKELESVYITTTSSSSSPSISEDISIREQIDEMRSNTPDNSVLLLPISQLGRLHDKLEVHTRAEQAALKKIRDLEMQIKSLRYDEEEVAAERDVLQAQVEEQLLKISLLHKNVEDQRSKADDMIQVASADLQKRLHDREIETRDLRKTLENKETQVKAVQVLLEQTRQAVTAQEAEWTDRIKKEQEVVQKLKHDYNKLKEARNQNVDPEAADECSGAGNSFGRYVPIPSLLDAVQANCNAEIAELQLQLEAYRTLKLTPDQREMLEKLLKRLKVSRKDCDPETCEAVSTTLLFEQESEASRDNNDDFSSSDAESDRDEGNRKKQLLRKDPVSSSLRNKQDARGPESSRGSGYLPRGMNEIPDLRDQLEKAHKRIQQLENDQAELKRIKAELANQSQSLRDCDGTFKESQASDIADIIAERDQLRLQIQTLIGSDGNVRDPEVETMRLERDRLKERLNELSSLQTNFKKLSDDSLSSSVLASEDVLRERDQLRQQLKEKEAAVADQDDEIRRLLAMIEKQSIANGNKEDIMNKSLSSLHLDMENKVQRISQLEDQLSELPKLQAEIQKLREELKNASIGSSANQSPVGLSESKLMADINSLEEDLKQERQLTKSLKDELNQLRAELDSLKLTGKSQELANKENKSLKEKLAAMASMDDENTELTEELERERKARADSEEQLKNALEKLGNKTTSKSRLLDAVTASTGGSSWGSNDELERERNARIFAENQVQILNNKLLEQANEYNKKIKEINEAGHRYLEEKNSNKQSSRGNWSFNDNSSSNTDVDSGRVVPRQQVQIDEDEMDFYRESTDSVNEDMNPLDQINALKKKLSRRRIAMCELVTKNNNLLEELEQLRKKDKLEGKEDVISKLDKFTDTDGLLAEVRSENDKSEFDELSDRKVIQQLANENKLLLAEIEKLKRSNAFMTGAETNVFGESSDSVNEDMDPLDQIKALKKKLANRRNAICELVTKNNNLLEEFGQLRNANEVENKEEGAVSKLDKFTNTDGLLTGIPSENDKSEFDHPSDRKEMQQLANENKLLLAEIEKLKKSNAIMTGAETNVSGKSTDRVNEAMDLLEQIEVLKKTLDHRRNAIDELVTKNNSLLEELEKLNKAEKVVDKEDVISKLDKSTETDDLLTTLPSKNDTSEFDQLSDRKETQLANGNKLLLAEIEELKKSNALLTATREDEQKYLKNKLNELQAENDALKLIQTAEDATLADPEHSDLNAVIRELENQVKSLEGKMNERPKESDNVGEKSIGEQNLSNSLEAYQNENRVLKEEAKELKVTMDRELSDLKEKCAEKENVIKELENQVKSLEGKMNQRAKESDNVGEKSISEQNLPNRLEADQNENRVLKEEAKDLKVTMDRELSDLKEKCANLETELAKWKMMKEDGLNDSSSQPIPNEQDEEGVKQSMNLMKEDYEKRIKDLLDEQEIMSKNYNNNLTTLKETYERDTKALNQRHKESVQRLQSLHEEEIQDMDKEFETQIKELGGRQSTSTFGVRPPSNLQDNKEKPGSDEMVVHVGSGKGSITDDVCKDKIEVLKKMYEKLMADEMTKHKMELDKLRAHVEDSHLLGKARTEVYELRPGGLEKVCPAPCAMAVRGTSPQQTISPSVAAILHKILEEGFEALTLEELTAVHEPLCSATGHMIAANPGLRPVNTSLQAVDPYQLCGRIYRLESEIKRKEQASQKKVCSLESSMDYEKQRLHDLKMALAEHERSNLELHSMLGNQQQLQCDLETEREMLRNEAVFQENKAITAMQQLEREKIKNRQMEDELQKERNNLLHLQALFDAERDRAINANIEESDLLQTMREHLNKSRDNENQLRSQLKKLMKGQQALPNESPRRPVCMAPCNTSLSQSSRDQHPAMVDQHGREIVQENGSSKRTRKSKDRRPPPTH